MDGWTSTQEIDKSRWELMKRHKRDEALAKIEAEYDALRNASELSVEQDAAFCVRYDAVLDEYELGMAYLEAHRLAEAIMPQLVGQLREWTADEILRREG